MVVHYFKAGAKTRNTNHIKSYNMNDQKIQSDDINVAQVFQDFYAVPNYQREYVWGEEQVEQLLEDIKSEFVEVGPETAPEYFIGSIVVCPGDGGVFDLIDGQQRMTTLFLILCALRDQIFKLGGQPPGALAPQLAATSTDVSGRDQYRYRLDLQYEDSRDILIKIADQKIVESGGKETLSIINIREAYNVVFNFLTQFKSVEELRSFYGYISNKVKLIRIQTEDVTKALKIFETINDRGVGLDSMDLLKNLLFMNANRDDFESLKSKWKELQDTLFKMREKPLRFLRYYLHSCYEMDAASGILREDEIYGWLSKNEKKCGYGSYPITFAGDLLKGAQDYRKLWKDDTVVSSESKSSSLESLRRFAGGATRQHLILLLAGRDLPDTLFNRLVREVEEILFVYFISRENPRDLERYFARWSSEMRNIDSAEKLNTFINQHFVKEKNRLSDRFDEGFLSLYYYSVPKYRLRYILAKLTQYIDLIAFDDIKSKESLSYYMDGGFEIEHIFPGNPSDEAKKEFGDFENEHIAYRLGNLILVEKPINASLGNRPYSEKRKVYPQSQLLLTRALPEQPQVGNDTKIDRAVKKIISFDKWNEATVEERQENLVVLARETWNLPTK